MSDIPLMYQAQIPGRGQVQYIAESEQAYKWVREWLRGTAPELPEFNSNNFVTVEQSITWRFLTNSGQDEALIRPVIGAKGYPYYPGSSMKGAFRRACESPEQRLRYCGGEITENGETKLTQGILRFHGGYLLDKNCMSDRRLVDIVHPQEDWQVKSQADHSAKILISLYKPKLIFGFSSRENIFSEEWEAIKEIWVRAMQKGLGSRTSAGYGHIKAQGNNRLIRVDLTGKGIPSKLPNNQPELRPNMFKATLRGHTLRLFGGVTDAPTAELLTKEIWGGFAGKTSITGHLGIAFNSPIEDSNLFNDYTYDLDESTLTIYCTNKPSDKLRKKLGIFTLALVKFSLLVGGFGKSWRRINHQVFYPSYLAGNDKPMIGSEWKFDGSSSRYYIPVNHNDLREVTAFLTKLRDDIIIPWVGQNRLNNNFAQWRESWHPNNVQVWGRIANHALDSKAVYWFHGNYSGEQSIKGTFLTGSLNKIGRIWHNMYPRYIIKNEQLTLTKEYVELLIIFPDQSQICTKFLEFLHQNSEFTLVYPRS